MATCYVVPGVFTIPDANDPPVVWMTKAEVDLVVDSWEQVPVGDRGIAFTCFSPHYAHVYDGTTFPLQTLSMSSGGALRVGVTYSQPPLP